MTVSLLGIVKLRRWTFVQDIRKPSSLAKGYDPLYSSGYDPLYSSGYDELSGS